VLSLSKEALHGTLPSELGALASLTTIDVNENAQLSGTLPSELMASPRLTQLYAYGSRISGTLPALSEARALQELEMSFCRLSGTLPSRLPNALRFVFLESNRISGAIPSSLATLRRLHELELSHNRFSGSLPARVARMPLQHLDVAKNPRLRGVPVAAPKQGCSGGSERYGPPRVNASA
jgi:Leucine-rich repeat (LRR) protein